MGKFIHENLTHPNDPKCIQQYFIVQRTSAAIRQAKGPYCVVFPTTGERHRATMMQLAPVMGSTMEICHASGPTCGFCFAEAVNDKIGAIVQTGLVLAFYEKGHIYKLKTGKFRLVIENNVLSKKHGKTRKRFFVDEKFDKKIDAQKARISYLIKRKLIEKKMLEAVHVSSIYFVFLIVI